MEALDRPITPGFLARILPIAVGVISGIVTSTVSITLHDASYDRRIEDNSKRIDAIDKDRVEKRALYDARIAKLETGQTELEHLTYDIRAQLSVQGAMLGVQQTLLSRIENKIDNDHK